LLLLILINIYKRDYAYQFKKKFKTNGEIDDETNLKIFYRGIRFKNSSENLTCIWLNVKFKQYLFKF
jgi:hypothetical protein